ncbi:hypothetical protein BDA96_05G073500 [Sorghum bicolor]|uniref:F-box domain-containing protein n=1 Tax=Sorghum bicolor TaxID=4558 RepID=A0A921UFL5_SORBI|nr:hypothetical protein BDA96_05G073500 [Sorghum bicolor]
MPPRGCKKAAKRASTEEPCVDDEDRISALPDAVLQHVLGFLPAQDAVRASVLGTRWSNLWRSTHRLRVALKPLWSAETQHMFVNRLLLLRDPRSAVEHCELDLRGCKLANTNYVEIWIRHALLLQARVLDVRYTTVLESRSLVSRFLKVLRLESVYFQSYILLDLSSCIALEDVEFSVCEPDFCEIRCPPSVTRLSMVKCSFGAVNGRHNDNHTRISAPSLTWLKIDRCDGLPPVLERMPSLQAASVWFGCSFEDDRSCSTAVLWKKDGCVLLGGLSNATSLKYRGSFGMATFKMDLAFCPLFTNLKTFCLEDFCLTSDVHALLRFLRLTPNLEKLTIELCEKKICSQLEVEGYNPIHPPISLSQLKKVNIKCPTVDERIQRALKAVFTDAGIGNLDKLNIEH